MDDTIAEKISTIESQLSHHKFMVASLMREIDSFENMNFFERLLFLFTKTIICEKKPIGDFYDKCIPQNDLYKPCCFGDVYKSFHDCEPCHVYGSCEMYAMLEEL